MPIVEPVVNPVVNPSLKLWPEVTPPLMVFLWERQ